ncbi:MAG: glycosyl hydrolase [Planctomycetes bacterium]|nr:glycosyl hydrolase [Planctomycetota bacterium]
MNSTPSNVARFLASALVALPAVTFLAAQTADRDHVADNVFGQMPWRELGPVTSGGRIVDIAVHPTRPGTFWAAAASGGLWKTTNGGISWSPQFQDQYSISIGDIAVAPSNGDVLYVGTGEGNNQRSSYWGNGVYRSDDGGASWNHTGLDGTDHIGRIAVHPTDPEIAFVAALGALYRGNETRGLYCTRNGGKSWQCVQHCGSDTGFVDVTFDATDPKTLFAASYERRRRAWDFSEGGEGSRIYRSQDGGSTWTMLAGGLPAGQLGRIGLEVFAGDGKTVYAAIENLNPRGTENTAFTPPTGDADPREPRDGDLLTDVPAEILADPVAVHELERRLEEAQGQERRPRSPLIGGEVYRSDDGGESWQKTNGETAIGGSPGYYYGQIRIDPNDRDTVYVLSVPVYKSTDGGVTWTPRSRRGGGGGGGRGGRSGDGDGDSSTFAQGLHVDHHALWIDPADGNHCLLGNDGGLSITWDGGDHWDHLPYLPILQCYTIAVDRGTPYRIYVGLQDNGTWGFPIHGETTDGIQSADAFKVGGGDGFYACIDPRDPNIVYSESQFGGINRADLRTGERSGIKPKAQKGQQALRFNWNTPILLSPHAPDTVYVGSQHLHRSRNRGADWVTISPDLSTNDADKKKGDVPHCTITTISESPKSEGMLWVGTDDGRVWLTRDAGQRWTDLTDRFPEPVRSLWVSRVEASPHDAAVAFVSYTGYREDIRTPFVFRTDDGGETWQAIAHDLPDEPVNVVRQHPRAANVLLVGTEMGVYVSVNDGADWFALGQGLPRVAVHDLVVHPSEPHVLLGTHGRGVFAMDASALESLTDAVLAGGFQALPPSGGVLLKRGVDLGYLGARRWSADNPFVTPTFRYLLAADSDQKVTIEVKDATGEVLWSEEASGAAGYHEVAWQLRGRGRGGFGGFSGFGAGRRGASGPRPGEFAVTLTHGEQSTTQRFEVIDRRPPNTVLGRIVGDEDLVLDVEDQGQGR